ncbi:MAG: endonuclease NucS [Haloferacaceae archaeon]
MTLRTLRSPAPREALTALSEAVDAGALVTVHGRCRVDYDGRASSELGPGDRLVVLKPDGAALVHTEEGRTPVNWQPPGSAHAASVHDDRLRVRSTRESPAERLDVTFEEVYQLTAMDAADDSDLSLTGSEADLREAVLAEPTLVADWFEPTATERETDAGPVDLFGRDGRGRPVVVELKRRRVGPDAVGQLRRYVDAVRREEGVPTVEAALADGAADADDGDADERESVPAVRGVLVAPSVTERAMALLDRYGFSHVALGPDAAADRRP